MNRLRCILPAVFGFLAVCSCALLAAQAQPTRADAEKDPVLKAMLTELDRSMSQLQLPGFADVYKRQGLGSSSQDSPSLLNAATAVFSGSATIP